MINFLKSVINEMKNIKWPTSKTIMISAGLVIFICLFISLFLHGTDLLLNKTILENKAKWNKNNVVNIDTLQSATSTDILSATTSATTTNTVKSTPATSIINTEEVATEEIGEVAEESEAVPEETNN